MSTAFNTRLSDREAIRDCLFLYCRGIDRADEQSLRRAYWPDAQDNHGPYCGDAEGFIAWAMAALKSFERSIHTLSNILIDFQEHGAHVESYFTARQRLVADGERQQLLMIGRYIDWFEPRDGEWRILRRTVVYDWVEEQTPPERAETDRFGLRQPVGRPWPDDIVYRSLQDG